MYFQNFQFNWSDFWSAVALSWQFHPMSGPAPLPTLVQYTGWPQSQTMHFFPIPDDVGPRYFVVDDIHPSKLFWTQKSAKCPCVFSSLQIGFFSLLAASSAAATPPPASWCQAKGFFYPPRGHGWLRGRPCALFIGLNSHLLFVKLSYFDLTGTSLNFFSKFNFTELHSTPLFTAPIGYNSRVSAQKCYTAVGL